MTALRKFVDTNANYTGGASQVPVFDKIYSRPLPADQSDPSFGRGTSEFIGQDSGDVFALLTAGYNFDGTQSPVVLRLGDATGGVPILSLPNFYGAHGYDPLLPHMSAIFYAAGPDIRHGDLGTVHNIDVAPTIARLLGVELSALVEGHALPLGAGPGSDLSAWCRRAGQPGDALPRHGSSHGRQPEVQGQWTAPVRARQRAGRDRHLASRATRCPGLL